MKCVECKKEFKDDGWDICWECYVKCPDCKEAENGMCDSCLKRLKDWDANLKADYERRK